LNRQLAIELLGHTLSWETETATEEIGELEYMAAVKYDGYRNFDAGNRFLESLILWLRQFKQLDERKCAYQFVKQRMLYFSETQMDHLVSLLFPQYIFPILCKQTCEFENISPYKINKICNTDTFKILRRRALFLGMSDGARMDAFRRKNALSHEQVCVSYELSQEKWGSIHKEFDKWMDGHNYETGPQLENIFLIDDFSGSGNSILCFNEEGEPKGKLNKFVSKYLEKYLNKRRCNLFVVTYIATETAIRRLRKDIALFMENIEIPGLESCSMGDPLQMLEDSIKVTPKTDEEFSKLLTSYYDKNLEDEITESGGTDLIYGYSSCALSLVLNHNCPNNSVYLLWGQTDDAPEGAGLEALFPRIARHEEGK